MVGPTQPSAVRAVGVARPIADFDSRPDKGVRWLVRDIRPAAWGELPRACLPVKR